MREDVAKVFEQMQAKPRPILYSTDEKESHSGSTASSPQPVTSAIDSGDEDDFELAEDVALYADDDDFELAGDVNDSVKAAAARRSQLDDLDDMVTGDAPSVSSSDKDSTDLSDEDSYQLASSSKSEPAQAADSSEENTDSDSDDPPKATRPKATESVPDVDHSVATGGEALWEIAQQESNFKRAKRTKQRSVKIRPGAILVYCPHGHRIEVQERHRGKIGKCPKCKTAFTVPLPLNSPRGDGSDSADSNEPQKLELEQHFANLHLHRVDPTKLKLKPGSLAKTFEQVDVCLGEEGLLLVTLVKKGLFGGKKEDEVRADLVEYVSLGQKLKNAPGETKHLFDIEELSQMATVFPTAYAHESIFGGINVFGPGLIAVRLPKRDEGKLDFLSMTLSQFRLFHQQMQKQCGIELKYEADQIPLQDKTTPSLCHYTDEAVRYLQNIEFYENDPAFELDLIGWKCQACGLTVSEDGRKKENIGGKNAKAIAKAKCPKCSNAFGKNPLYALKVAEEPVQEEAFAESESTA